MVVVLIIIVVVAAVVVMAVVVAQSIITTIVWVMRTHLAYRTSFAPLGSGSGRAWLVGGLEW